MVGKSQSRSGGVDNGSSYLIVSGRDLYRRAFPFCLLHPQGNSEVYRTWENGDGARRTHACAGSGRGQRPRGCAALRLEYRRSVIGNLKGQLDNTVVIRPDGSSYRPADKDKSKK